MRKDKWGRLGWLVGVGLTAICLGSAAVNAEEAPLVFGLLPSESATTKIRRYAPLRDYLIRHLHRRVVLETARDFKTFIKRTEERRYDFLETAPHFVPPAIEAGRYHVLTTITRPMTAVVVVARDSPLTRVEELGAGRVAIPSPRAIVTRVGKDYLRQLGLIGTRAPQYHAYPTHNGAYEAALGKLQDAAIISVNVYNKALNQGQPLRMLGQSVPFPNMSILVAADVPEKTRQRLQAVLVGMKDQARGREVLKAISYPGYRAAKKEEFEMLRRYLNPPSDG